MPNRKNLLHCRRNAAAFTLVEILLAMTLTGLIVAISGRVVLQMSETRNSVENAAARMQRRTALELVMTEDFARLLPLLIKDKPPLVVVEGSVLVLELPALTFVSTEDESLHTPLRPCLVRYWKHHDIDGKSAIVREAIDLTDPAHVFGKEQVAKGIDAFNIAVRRKGDWNDVSSVTLIDAKDVEAVRIGASWIGDAEIWQQTFRMDHAK